MDKIYIFNSHGKRNDLETRVELATNDSNIYINLAYPGFSISTYESLICLCAFKNTEFVNYFNEQMQTIGLIQTSQLLYEFERTIESKMIQAAWQTVKTFLSSNPTNSEKADYQTIRDFYEYMSNFLKSDSTINVDVYKANSGFLLSFYFKSDYFDLSMPDFSFSTHLYYIDSAEVSGLSPISFYDYNLKINSGKIQCDNNGKIKLNGIIRQMYNYSVLPTKKELKRRYKVKCIDSNFLAVSKFLISSTEQFLNYIQQRIGLDRNIIFLANCSVLAGYNTRDSRSLIRIQSIDLKSDEVGINTSDEIIPQVKELDLTNDATFNATDSDKSDNYIDSSEADIPEQALEQGLEPGSAASFEPAYNPVFNPEYFSNYSQIKNVIFETREKYYQANTPKIYKDKIKETTRPNKTNNIVALINDLRVSYTQRTFEPSNNFYVLRPTTYDPPTINLIHLGVKYSIENQIEPNSLNIIIGGLTSLITSKDFKDSFNRLDRSGYDLDRFYSNYFILLPDNQIYSLDILKLFVRNLNSFEHFDHMIQNQANAFEQFGRFVSPELISNQGLEITIEPIHSTKTNYMISRGLSFQNVNTWAQQPKPINFWFIGVSGIDYNIQVINKLEKSGFKQKYLKYKKKYLDLKLENLPACASLHI